MSRSGYTDDYDGDCEDGLALFRGRVANAIKGERGQAFLRELVAALDAMPVKELAADVLVADGQCCAIGAVAIARGYDPATLPTHDAICDDAEPLANIMGISETLTREIMFWNDDDDRYRSAVTDATRWTRMRRWAVENLRRAKA